jgi:predicted amidohydrolase YtcJ
MRRWYLVIPLGAALAAGIWALGSEAREPQAWQPHADLILTGGKIVTVDSDFTIAEAMAIKDGRIIAVGRQKEVFAHRGSGTAVTNLGGRTVIPGIQDSHIHFLELGRDVREQADLTFARDAEDIVQSIADLKRRLNPRTGQWLVGSRWDQYKYPEMVTRWQLDEITPDNPVRLDRTYRGVVLNTAALREMGIHDEKPETWPSWWLKDPPDFTFEDRIFRETREVVVAGKRQQLQVPTGAFLGSRARPRIGKDTEARLRRRRRERQVGRGRDASPRRDEHRGTIVAHGISHARIPGSLQQGLPEAAYSSRLRRNLQCHLPESIRNRLDAVKINNLGDGFLRWRGTKYYADGGAGTRSAWMSDSFARWEEFEGTENAGYPVVADNAVREEQFRAAVDYGWDIHTHAAAIWR